MRFTWRVARRVFRSTRWVARLLFLMKTIVVGLGNPILGDDGVGWKVAEEVQKQLASIQPPLPIALPKSTGTTLAPPARAGVGSGATADAKWGDGEIHVEFLSLGGISLMEHLVGYERAVLIDAIALDQPNGTVLVSKLSELPDYAALHTTSVHDTSLQNALKLGKEMGADLPEEVLVVGIVTDQVYDFGEKLSPPVAEAVPQAAKIVIDLL